VQVCSQLKGFCLRHEWAGGAAALVGVGLFIVTLWFGIEQYLLVRAWVAQNPLVHGLLFGAGTLLDVMVVYGLLCLGFSECSPSDRQCVHAYRGRRSTVFPELTRWVDGLGTNPRRLPGRN
jgi:hypothetical protein